MGLELVERGLDLPPLGVQLGQLGRGCLVRVGQGRGQPVGQWLGPGLLVVAAAGRIRPGCGGEPDNGDAVDRVAFV